MPWHGVALPHRSPSEKLRLLCHPYAIAAPPLSNLYDHVSILRTRKDKERSVMPESEPPSTPLPSPPRLFRVGRDSHGNWVAQDQQGLCGGLFAKRGDEVEFPMVEA